MLNVYCVHDKVANRVVCTFHCENDGLAIRENAPALSKVAPLGDLELINNGQLDESTFVLTPIAARVVDWTSYKFPESPIRKIGTSEVTK